MKLVLDTDNSSVILAQLTFQFIPLVVQFLKLVLPCINLCINLLQFLGDLVSVCHAEDSLIQFLIKDAEVDS